MIVRNRGYAAYLIIIKGYQYKISNNKIEIDISNNQNEILLDEYRKSPYRKFNRLLNKFLYNKS